MISLKAIYLILFSLNTLGLLSSILYFSLSNLKRNTSEDSFLSEIREDSPNSYSFIDPVKAHFFLEKLDVFGVVPASEIRDSKYAGEGKAHGYKVNTNYCEEHRAYFVQHPELVFEKLHMVASYPPQHVLKTHVMPSIGAVNLHPELHSRSGKLLDEFKYDMRIDANLFFTHHMFYYTRQIGKEFSCLSQMSNHIHGHDTMTKKDFLGNALVNYAQRYRSQPNCFNFETLFPKTWVLSKKEQCKDFFEEFNSPRYQELKKERGVVYFRKIGRGVHSGKGVFPVNDDEENYISEVYQNGTLCGKVRENNLIQYNVHNLLLIDNRRFGFRMYMLVASTNPLLVYFHDGYVQLSIYDYDPNSKALVTFVTNIVFNASEAQERTGFTEAELEEANVWSLEEFHKYLTLIGRVRDPNWLDNHVRPEMKRVMIHLIRMAQGSFLKQSSIFELFGLDFVMDQNLNLWFIEANALPYINGWTNKTTIMLKQMITNLIEVEIGLLKSRMKRVIDYVNALSKEESYESFLLKLDEKREEFRELTKNYFEPEFVPRPENGFQKIVDVREEGVKRYAGLLKEECL